MINLILFKIILYKFIMDFPKDTRNDSKAVHRDNLIFPNTLPTYMPQTDFRDQNTTDIYDRNIFSVGANNNFNSYQNYNSSSIQSDRIMDYSNMTNYNNNNNAFSDIPQFTRSKRGEEEKFKFNKQLPLNNNNFNNDINNQMNFMGFIPRDTRRSGDKQIQNNNISSIQNRMTGIPFEKLD